MFNFKINCIKRFRLRFQGNDMLTDWIKKSCFFEDSLNTGDITQTRKRSQRNFTFKSQNYKEQKYEYGVVCLMLIT
jgi:hypothetical protein